MPEPSTSTPLPWRKGPFRFCSSKDRPVCIGKPSALSFFGWIAERTTPEVRHCAAPPRRCRHVPPPWSRLSRARRGAGRALGAGRGAGRAGCGEPGGRLKRPPARPALAPRRRTVLAVAPRRGGPHANEGPDSGPRRLRSRPQPPVPTPRPAPGRGGRLGPMRRLQERFRRWDPPPPPPFPSFPSVPAGSPGWGRRGSAAPSGGGARPGGRWFCCGRCVFLSKWVKGHTSVRAPRTRRGAPTCGSRPLWLGLRSRLGSRHRFGARAAARAGRRAPGFSLQVNAPLRGCAARPSRLAREGEAWALKGK